MREALLVKINFHSPDHTVLLKKVQLVPVLM